MTRRIYTPEFKVAAARKVLDDELTISEACNALGIGPTAMRRWVKQLTTERGGKTAPGSKPITPDKQRICELEAQVRRLTEEREILKKATAFFVQEQTGKRWFSK